MAFVDNILGNLLIKYHDKWRGNYYLMEDLSFTPNREDAARFYILKAGDTLILNGDRVSINVGNRTLVVNSNDTLQLIDREQLQYQLSRYKFTNFIVTNGNDTIDPVGYESPLFIISDKINKTALKYEWGMELVINTPDISDPSNYKPSNHPTLINGSYNEDVSITAFKFSFERADGPITNIEEAKTRSENNPISMKKNFLKSESFEGYRTIIIVILLLIVLILCIILNR